MEPQVPEFKSGSITKASSNLNGYITLEIYVKELTFIKASSCFAPRFLSRFATLAIPAEHN